MPSPRPALILLALSCGLSGCTYLSRQETLQPWSGDARNHNLAASMQDPWPPYAQDTDIATPGGPQADAYDRLMRRHRKEQAPPPSVIIAK